MSETQQQLRVVLVLERLIQLAIEDEDNAQGLSDWLEAGLDDLQGSDFFGTEGQCDPRGDFRDDVWTMEYVQGIDE